MQYFEVWESQIYPLEDTAEEKIGDDAIDEIFEVVSDAIGDTVWKKFEEYIDSEIATEIKTVRKQPAPQAQKENIV